MRRFDEVNAQDLLEDQNTTAFSFLFTEKINVLLVSGNT